MSTNRKPTHTIWAIERNGDKSFWSAIGAGWTETEWLHGSSSGPQSVRKSSFASTSRRAKDNAKSTTFHSDERGPARGLYS